MEQPCTTYFMLALCVVVIGLICLTITAAVMGYLCGRARQNAPVAAAPARAPIRTSSTGAARTVQAADPIAPEIVAAISAAVAEELGTGITGIRIRSIKRI